MSGRISGRIFCLSTLSYHELIKLWYRTGSRNSICARRIRASSNHTFIQSCRFLKTKAESNTMRFITLLSIHHLNFSKTQWQECLKFYRKYFYGMPESNKLMALGVPVSPILSTHFSLFVTLTSVGYVT